jgi:hypothetical protein
MSGGLSASDVNASIPLQAGVGVTPAANPLQSIGQFADLKNSLNQLKMFPGQQQLQQQAVTSGGLGIQSQKADLAQQFRQQGYNGLVSLLAKPSGTITHHDLTGALGGLEASGISTQPIISDILQEDPLGDGPEFDTRLRGLISTNAQTSSAQAVAEVTPTQGTIDNGSAIQPVNIAPAGGANVGQVTPAGGDFAKTLSPEQLATPVQIGVVQSGSNKGAPIMGTMGQFLQMQSGGNAGGSASPSPGAFPSALVGPGGNAPPPPTAGSPGGPGVVTGLGPAQTTALQTQGSASADAFQQIASSGVAARSQNAILGNMLDDAGQFTTGPGLINDVRNFVNRYAAIGGLGLGKGETAANESFDKFANQIADAQGAGSDARLAVNQAANPSSHLSPQGVQLIIRQLQGNSDYLQARSQLAVSYPDQTDRAGFEALVGTSLDPRAFQFDRMTAPQRKTYVDSLSPTDKTAVQKAYNYAYAHGLLQQ